MWHRLTIEIGKQRLMQRHRAVLRGRFFGASAPESYTVKASFVFMEDEDGELSNTIAALRGAGNKFITGFNVEPVMPGEVTDAELNDIRQRRDRAEAFKQMRQIIGSLGGNVALLGAELH